MFYVVLLAMIAGFLAMRLYSVLGKRTGHEQSLAKPAEERLVSVPVPRTIDAVPDLREPAAPAADGKAQSGLRAIAAADPSFDVVQFVDGAKSAYRMILEAFWKGDEQTLDWLTEPEVRSSFGDAIAARSEAGHVLDNRLVVIERASIVEASLHGRDAKIAVRFDSDISSITRDGEGNVIAGSMTDAVETHEVWTFARTLKSSDPNWKLADTDEA
ncbi:Tim44/TimA family putative adaptor protein [soil metagenome]